MARVSVIIPVYNGENTIKPCLESVLSQTLEDLEVIVVDDGSTDNTEEMLKSLKDSRVKILKIANSGQGIARNYGIDAAEGEYLSFIDADDTVEKDMLEKMYRAAKENDADMVQCDIKDIYPDGQSREQLGLNDETVDIRDRGEYMDKYFTPCIHSYEVCNKLIKREVIGNLRFKDTRKYYSEDLLFNMELIERLRGVTFISDALYNYYQSDTSHIHTGGEKLLAGLTALFADYVEAAPADMRASASYTGAMVLSYSVGSVIHTAAAAKMLKSSQFKGYIKAALGRARKKKHKMFLIMMNIMPFWGKKILCKKFSERWR